MSRLSRPATCALLDLVEEGVLDARMLAECCLAYMSEADVADMASVNELLPEPEEDEEEPEDDEDDDQGDDETETDEEVAS